ncbi:hypothetical protein HPP92_022316, partial [Vanilla planifolia]
IKDTFWATRRKEHRCNDRNVKVDEEKNTTLHQNNKLRGRLSGSAIGRDSRSLPVEGEAACALVIEAQRNATQLTTLAAF